MIRLLITLLLLAVSFVAGGLLYPKLALLTHGHSASSERQPLYWVAPMDPNYRRDGPGKSPMGMDLVPVYEEPESAGDGGISLSPRLRQNLGVRTADVTQGTLAGTIDAVGQLVLAEEALYHVHSRVSGWVEKLYLPNEGMPVASGQIMLELFSPQLQGAQEEFLLAHRTDNTRLRQAAHNNLLALGVPADQIESLASRGTASPTVQLRARRGGFLQQLNIREGMFVQPATEIATVAALDEIWLEAEVFERQAARVAAGMPVTVILSAFPGEQWQAQVDYRYPSLNTDTRTLRLRIRLPNPDHRLLPGMFAHAQLHYELGEALVSVPRQAVIRDGRQDRVIVAEGQGYFRPVPVALGAESGDRLVILSGLEPGQRVVTAAHFLIDSETNLEQAMARLAEPEPEPAQRISGQGVIDLLSPDIGLVTLTHEPIPALGWPAMTMDFDVVESIDLSAFQEGQAVTFDMDVFPSGDYLILHMQPTDRGEQHERY